jgi:NAD(P)H-hydrate epimerase
MDRRAIDRDGIPGLVLMENAGIAVAKEAETLLRETGGRRILACCGKGNNGGDAMAAACHLIASGFDVRTVVFSGSADVKGDALSQLRKLEESGIPVQFVTEQSGLSNLDSGDLIIDGLLGTGISGAVTGLYADAIQWINRTGVPVLAVDLPSGLNGDTGSFSGTCVLARRTVTFAQLKRGLAFYPGRILAGNVVVADIGIPEPTADFVGVSTFLLEAFDVRNRLPARPPDGHKGTFGKVLIIAGSTGMTGASVLSSLASLRAGAGMALLGIPESLNPVLEAFPAEVITRPLPQTPSGSLCLQAESGIRELFKWADVAAIGPGMSRHPETADLIRRVVPGCPLPLVLDADGLNAFEGRTDLLRKRKKPTVLTPHAGELSRLSGLSVSDITSDPIAVSKRCAQEWGTVLVLKGAPTVIAESSGRAFVNSTGNSGMATAGSGDVLTGLIAGLLAQRVPAFDAAASGVFLHGLAGDIVAAESNPRSLIAGDLLARIGPAFSRVEATG